MKTHGKTGSKAYSSWIAIKSRCLNPNSDRYRDYGGRGITICAEWRDDFSAFYRYVGDPPSPKHTIDRFPNNDGNYEPENVRWATAKEQGLSRRNRLTVTHQGRTQTLQAWSEELGIPYQVLRRRLQHAEDSSAILRPPSSPAKQTRCKNGHELTPENTHTRSTGWRDCRVCHAEGERRRRAARSAVYLAPEMIRIER